MIRLQDMSIPELLSLISKLEKMVKIMAIVAVSSAIFYINIKLYLKKIVLNLLIKYKF